MHNEDLRELAILLLADPHGISTESYNWLMDSLVSRSMDCSDIACAVVACEGRWFLPEDCDIRRFRRI